MAPAVVFEDFSDPADPERLIARPARVWEAERAALWAEAHAAGRAEAEAGAAARAAEAQAALARTLADFDITHAEMRAHLLRALAPLMRAIAGVMVPRLAARGLADHLVAEIGGLADARLSAGLSIRVAPADLAPLRAALAGDLPGPPELVAEPGREPGTARIVGLAAEREVDPGRAADRIAGLIDAFLDDEATRPAAAAPDADTPPAEKERRRHG